MSDAIEASSVRCKTLADGSLDVTLRIEPRDALAAFTLLREPGQPCAIAALKTAAQAQAAERAKGGEAARWLGIRCRESEFHEWVCLNWPNEWSVAKGRTIDEVAADTVRQVCRVNSRAEIDNDPEAFQRFDSRIRRPWLEHTKTSA